MPCVVCGKDPTDVDHIKTRGAGGGDEWENTWELCRTHHRSRHYLGLPHFALKNAPNTLKALDERGWKVERVMGVRRVIRK